MSENRFILCNKTTDSNVWDTLEKQCYGWEYVVSLLNELNDENDILKQQLQTRYIVNKQYEELQRLKKENKLLKQKIQRWKTLYEIKDAEVTARVDALNEVCEYYLTEAQFKADTDPNEAVHEVINRILNTEVKW